MMNGKFAIDESVLDRIRALRTEAVLAGDTEQVELCDLALTGNGRAIARCLQALYAAECAQ